MIIQRISSTSNFITWFGSLLLLTLFGWLGWQDYQHQQTVDVLQKWALAFLVSELVLLLLLSDMQRVTRRLMREILQQQNVVSSEERKASALLTKIASQLPGMVFQFKLAADGSASFPYCSEGIRTLYHLTPEQVKHSAEPVFALIHPDDIQQVRDSISQSAALMSLWKQDHRLQYPDGEVIWVAGRSVPEQQSDGSVLWHGFISDITERKKIERLKDEFVSTVSHELRTPLTAISGAIGLLHGQVCGELPAQAMQMTELAQANVKKLQLLINDLLDMDKLIAGKMLFDMQPQPLRPVIEASVRDNHSYGQQYQVTYHLQVDAGELWVNIDSMRLQQVMTNLLSNAAKFSPAGSTVDVLLQRQEQQALIRVIDRGCGISDEFKTDIFNKFSQADSSDSKTKGGTGLGLAISQQLMTRMQGSIGFYSEPGKGSEFYLLLPLISEADSPEVT